MCPCTKEQHIPRMIIKDQTQCYRQEIHWQSGEVGNGGGEVKSGVEGSSLILFVLHFFGFAFRQRV